MLTLCSTNNLGKQTVHADGNISYVDHTDDERMAVAHQGLAEYHTGTGYGNTLFDSADKKTFPGSLRLTFLRNYVNIVPQGRSR